MVQADLFLKPVPAEIGMVQCELTRNKSGFNKFWPRYELSVSGSKTPLLSSKKLANSKTSHYRIELANVDSKYKKDNEEPYIGRLRGTYSNYEFYIFDTGLKESDMKPGQAGAVRRQLGTLIYPPDKFGDKNPRKLEAYLPLVDDDNPKDIGSWPDDDYKKSNIFFEYNQ
jgi:hypothetical protein